MHNSMYLCGAEGYIQCLFSFLCNRKGTSNRLTSDLMRILHAFRPKLVWSVKQPVNSTGKWYWWICCFFFFFSNPLLFWNLIFSYKCYLEQAQSCCCVSLQEPYSNVQRGNYLAFLSCSFSCPCAILQCRCLRRWQQEDNGSLAGTFPFQDLRALLKAHASNS